MKKVFAFAMRKNNKYELCPSDLFDKSVVVTKDHKNVFDKNSKKLWEYFHKQLKACKKDSKSEEFYINGKLVNVVYGSGITAEELNDMYNNTINKSKQVKIKKQSQAEQFIDKLNSFKKKEFELYWGNGLDYDGGEWSDAINYWLVFDIYKVPGVPRDNWEGVDVGTKYNDVESRTDSAYIIFDDNSIAQLWYNDPEDSIITFIKWEVASEIQEEEGSISDFFGKALDKLENSDNNKYSIEATYNCDGNVIGPEIYNNKDLVNCLYAFVVNNSSYAKDGYLETKICDAIDNKIPSDKIINSIFKAFDKANDRYSDLVIKDLITNKIIYPYNKQTNNKIASKEKPFRYRIKYSDGSYLGENSKKVKTEDKALVFNHREVANKNNKNDGKVEKFKWNGVGILFDPNEFDNNTNKASNVCQAQQFLDFIDDWNKKNGKDVWDWQGDFDYITSKYDDEGTERCIYEILATRVLKLCSPKQYKEEFSRKYHEQVMAKFHMVTEGNIHDEHISYFDEKSGKIIDKTSNYDLPEDFRMDEEHDYCEEPYDYYYILFEDDSLLFIHDHSWREIYKDEFEILFPKNSKNYKKRKDTAPKARTKKHSEQEPSECMIEVGYTFTEDDEGFRTCEFSGITLLDCLEEFINTEYQINNNDLLNDIKNAKASGMSMDDIIDNIIYKDFDSCEDEFVIYYVKDLYTGEYLYGGPFEDEDIDDINDMNELAAELATRKAEKEEKKKAVELDFIVNRMRANLNTIDKWIKPQYLDMTKQILSSYPDVSDKQTKALFAANEELTKWFKNYPKENVILHIDDGEKSYIVTGTFIECIDKLNEKLPGYSKLALDISKRDEINYIINSLNAFRAAGFKSILDKNLGNQFIFENELYFGKKVPEFVRAYLSNYKPDAL